VAQQDLSIGIPNLLICMEMSLFSVLHLWAFPWHPYTIANQLASDHSDLYGAKVAYHGGPLGWKAFLEAFNPWDLLKAIGRGFRWLFVGRKQRTMDPSYMGQPGTSFTLTHSAGGAPGSNIPGSDMSSDRSDRGDDGAVENGPIRYGPLSDDEEQQLLSNAQPNPTSPHLHHSSGVGPADKYGYEEDRPGPGRSPSPSQTGEEPRSSLRPISPQPDQPHTHEHGPLQPSANEQQQQLQKGEWPER
jgi:Organic solute transporter Ostalpha